MRELETKSVWNREIRKILDFPLIKCVLKVIFGKKKSSFESQKILADENSIFRTLFFEFEENRTKKGAEFSAPFLISVFFENYLSMVCSLSGPTETTFTGISSSFSIKSI